MIQNLLNFFISLLQARKQNVEYSILNRLNCHKAKFDELFKDKDFKTTFVAKNRYPDMLPFGFNRVQLNKNFRPFLSLRASREN